MKTALLIEILQIVGGLVLVVFAGTRLARLVRRSKAEPPGDKSDADPER